MRPKLLIIIFEKKKKTKSIMLYVCTLYSTQLSWFISKKKLAKFSPRIFAIYFYCIILKNINYIAQCTNIERYWNIYDCFVGGCVSDVTYHYQIRNLWSYCKKLAKAIHNHVRLKIRVVCAGNNLLNLCCEYTKVIL